VPAELDAELTWVAAPCPGTAAGAWRAAGLWTDDDDVDFDAFDWWFRTGLRGDADQPTVVHFDGIATIADVWLDGQHVLHSENMFVAHEIAVPAGEIHELVVVCRSLNTWLATRRPRGRWKTRLVAQQQLRWARTTLLGRMPSWLPRAAPVGLWREVRVAAPAPRLDRVRLATRVDGTAGTLDLVADGGSLAVPTSARLILGNTVGPLEIRVVDGSWSVRGSVTLDEPALWWPATHGEPALHAALVDLDFADGSNVAVPLGSVGFRSIEVDTSDGGLAISVNGVAVFCRGACWVPIDPVTLSASPNALRHALRQVVEAGMNMVRLTGTMVYEQREFYELCDELGIMVWQDLMFANMDYPVDDEGFADTVAVEIDQVLDRLGQFACLAVVCGGSEVEQQAAMMGLDPADTAHRFGREVLAALVGKAATPIAYIANSPSGGPFPFSVSTGVSHYYGVGAYRRPLDDARRASVRFTTECLAFANVGGREALEPFIDAGDGPGHSPRWKRGVPRDRGAGWDFEDVRDHYVRELFRVEPAEIRSIDPARYLDLGRAAAACAIESTLGEWRRPGSTCNGALLFTMRDMVAGPGWGVLDSAGRPKSAYYAAARASAPVAVWVTDEGLDGIAAHVANDRPSPLVAELRVRLFDLAGHQHSEVFYPLELPAHSSRTLSVDALLGGFRDLTSAYRFGPQAIDVVSIQLLAPAGLLGEATFLPSGHARAQVPDVGLQAEASRVDGDAIEVSIRTSQFAQYVSVDATGHDADQSWFHLAPGDERTVRLSPRAGGRVTTAPMIDVGALNSLARISARLRD
ncbi:MAG: beta-mannosidase, partial [Ilumatobacteraceae bacterium]|nr:beta-mannosidase [Ilumatobacteraceae bacterium]